ncbi:unnamed protein product [Ranitomeya imitator]|uniref:Uncharacterized protein n=1 Tax=Ranitomeya imitator TaxID=111125 RepID=A0ABN9KSL6_9NEOB|nr:unnamed protein product [Ranitomeya imitator]
MYIIISVIKYYHWHMRTRVSLHNELFDHTAAAAQVMSELRWIKSLEVGRSPRNIKLWRNVSFGKLQPGFFMSRAFFFPYVSPGVLVMTTIIGHSVLAAHLHDNWLIIC